MGEALQVRPQQVQRQLRLEVLVAALVRIEEFLKLFRDPVFVTLDEKKEFATDAQAYGIIHSDVFKK